MSGLEVSDARFLGDSFVEFFSAMEQLSGLQKQEIAVRMGVDGTAYSRWSTGGRIPRSKVAREKISTFFGLTAQEFGTLRERSVQYRVEQERSSEETANISNYREQLLGAFTVRAEAGPPLNESEAQLIQFLLDSESVV